MARAVFREEVSKIIEKCRKSDLSDVQIFELFDEIAHVRPQKISKNLKKSRTRCVCGWFIGVIAAIVSFFILLSFMLNYKPAEYYLDHYGHNLAYPLLRFSRLITLPLSSRFDLTSLYYEDCLVNNPFHKVERDCQICEGVKRFHTSEVESLDTNFEDNWSQPMIWKNIVPQDVTLEQFLELIEGNLNLFQSTMKVFSSANTTIRSVEELMSGRRDVTENPDIYLLWQVRGSGALKSIRDLTWRPEYVDMTPTMFIQVKGHSAAGTALPVSDENVLVAEAQGQSEVTLSPVGDCAHICKTSIVDTLSPKDILYFHSGFWELTTKPLGTEVNLIFVSTY